MLICWAVLGGFVLDAIFGDPAWPVSYTHLWVETGCEGRCPGGESKAEFCQRVCTAFAALVDACLLYTSPERPPDLFFDGRAQYQPRRAV